MAAIFLKRGALWGVNTASKAALEPTPGRSDGEGTSLRDIIPLLFDAADHLRKSSA